MNPLNFINNGPNENNDIFTQCLAYKHKTSSSSFCDSFYPRLNQQWFTCTTLFFVFYVVTKNRTKEYLFRTSNPLTDDGCYKKRCYLAYSKQESPFSRLGHFLTVFCWQAKSQSTEPQSTMRHVGQPTLLYYTMLLCLISGEIVENIHLGLCGEGTIWSSC